MRNGKFWPCVAMCLGLGLVLMTLRTLDERFVNDSLDAGTIARLSVSALMIGAGLMGLVPRHRRASERPIKIAR